MANNALMPTIFSDIHCALEHDCLFAALALALTLPDICGKAEYPDEKGKNRYVQWYNEYIGKYYQEASRDERNNDNFPYLDGEAVYSLRCSYLHQGTPNINREQLKTNACMVDKFTLITDRYDQNVPLIFSSCKSTENSGASYRSYSIFIRFLCDLLCRTVENYYLQNQDKFTFFNYNITSFDEMENI